MNMKRDGIHFETGALRFTSPIQIGSLHTLKLRKILSLPFQEFLISHPFAKIRYYLTNSSFVISRQRMVQPRQQIIFRLFCFDLSGV